MDYLDPQKERAQTIRLIVGYLLIGVAILIGTLILLYQAYGFGLNKDGEVIQNGLVFVSSQPTGAEIYLNNTLHKSATNAKLQLPAGEYQAELRRTGYASWRRLVTVEGGSVQHFDYPRLFPNELKTANLKSYPETPGLATQSPDRRWLLVQQTSVPLAFDLYDVANPDAVMEKLTTVTLPEALLTQPRAGAHSLKLTEWSTDNRHVVLEHNFDVAGAAGSEYILLDRENPAASLNLTRTLSLTATQRLELFDKKFNRYYVYDTAARTLGMTTVDAAGAVTPLLEAVMAYKTFGDDMVLYVTDKTAPAGQVVSMLYDDGNTYKIREHGNQGPFLIDLAEYSNDWYVVVGASADDKVYIYKNPQRVRKASNTAVLVPVQIMRMDNPNKLQFSSNTEHVMLENGTTFVNYDAETDKGYRYTSQYPIDAPAAAAVWMDSHRLTYISGGKVVVYDYDNINGRQLVPAAPGFLPIFDRDYEHLYTLAPVSAGGVVLTSTSLLTPADQ